jgi:hypothetical protein
VLPALAVALFPGAVFLGDGAMAAGVGLLFAREVAQAVEKVTQEIPL